MLTILLNALGLLLIILVGYMLKTKGFVQKEDGKVLTTIIVTVTIPATIVVGLNELIINSDLIFLASLAIGMNLGLVLVAKFLWRDKEQLPRTLFMYSISGYNIGNFTLPFVQSFLPLAIPYLFMFDIGNALMISGGTTVIVEADQGSQQTPSWRQRFQPLLSSIPFLTYLFMLTIRAFQLSFPTTVIDLFSLFSIANGFLSMLVIGIYLELSLPAKESRQAWEILSWRYAFAAVIAAAIYFLLPARDPLLKSVAILLCFAPVPTFAVINSVAAGVKEELTGYLSSVSILISLALMTFLVLLITAV